MALLSLNPLVYGQGLNPDPQRRFRNIYEFPLGVKEQEYIQQILCQSLLGDMDKEMRKSIAICLANWIKGSCKLDEQCESAIYHKADIRSPYLPITICDGAPRRAQDGASILRFSNSRPLSSPLYR